MKYTKKLIALTMSFMMVFTMLVNGTANTDMSIMKTAFGATGDWSALSSVAESPSIFMKVDLTKSKTNKNSVEIVKIKNILEDMAETTTEEITYPKFGPVAGEWLILALARGNQEVPEGYYDKYYADVVKELESKKGILTSNKYTEYSRLILGLSSIGVDPTDVGGYNLFDYLQDLDKIKLQGINGPTYALLAYNSNDYDFPASDDEKSIATEDALIQAILDEQLDDGGFALSKAVGVTDIDITAMVLQALSAYQDREDVKAATDKALEKIEKLESEDGYFIYYGIENCESLSQVIIALTSLGINPANDDRFVKGDYNLVDNLIDSFYEDGKGFKHTESGSVSESPTQQAVIALTSYLRLLQGETDIYDMTDAETLINKVDTEPSDKENVEENSEGKTYTYKFSDIADSPQKDSILKLASAGIIAGKTFTTFAPEDGITRAEIAKIAAVGLKFKESSNNVFNDVDKTKWYADYISACANAGLINGIQEGNDFVFKPDDYITRQEVAAIIARAAESLGEDANLSNSEILTYLCGFSDYTKSTKWARKSLAVCLKYEFMPSDDLTLRPTEYATREEVAEMFANMLEKYDLLK